MGNSEFPLCVLDTFTRTSTGKAFTGNPAAVVLLNWDDEIDNERKQEIAIEVNQSVTVFVSRGWSPTANLNSSSNWTARWYSPAQELVMCGHGSLAAAAVIYTKNPELTSITFEAPSGQILESKLGLDGLILLKFPACPPEMLNPASSKWLPELIEKVVGSTPEVGIAEAQYSAAGQKILLRLKASSSCDPETLIRSVCPDLPGMLNTVPKSSGLIGVGLTIENNETGSGLPHFYSRFFAPWVGLDEDEVCGSFHAVLTPYWSVRLGTGSQSMLSRFASRRTGNVYVKLDGDSVWISGRTTKTFEGTFFN